MREKKKKTSLVQELQKTRGNGHVGEQWHLRRCLADLHVSEPTKKKRLAVEGAIKAATVPFVLSSRGKGPAQWILG